MPHEPANIPIWQTIVITILCSSLSAFISGYIGYRFGIRSKRMERQWAAEDAKTKRRTDFIEFANSIKTTIRTHPDPGTWVKFFRNNSVDFIAAYQMATGDFGANEAPDIHEAMQTVIRFAAMNPGDIYNNDQELHAALLKIPAK